MHLVPLEPRVHRNDRATGAERAERGDQPFVAVRRPDGDAFPGSMPDAISAAVTRRKSATSSANVTRRPPSTTASASPNADRGRRGHLGNATPRGGRPSCPHARPLSVLRTGPLQGPAPLRAGIPGPRALRSCELGGERRQELARPPGRLDRARRAPCRRAGPVPTRRWRRRRRTTAAALHLGFRTHHRDVADVGGVTVLEQPLVVGRVLGVAEDAVRPFAGRVHLVGGAQADRHARDHARRGSARRSPPPS